MIESPLRTTNFNSAWGITVIGDELDGEDSVADRRDDHRPDDWIVHPREAT